MERKPDKWRFVKRRASKLGWTKAIGQVIFQVIVPSFLKIASKSRIDEILKKKHLSLASIPPDRIISVNSINSKESINCIVNYAPDIIIVNGTRIISKKVLRASKAKFINTHLGITPMYRGVHGGYWALAMNDKKNFGSTIHFVDEGIDTGTILKQVKITPTRYDNFVTYPFLQLAFSLPLMVETIKEVLAGIEKPMPYPKGKSQLWYHPTIWGYITNLVREGVK